MFGKSLAKCIYNYPFLKLILQHTLQGWDDEEKKKAKCLSTKYYTVLLSILANFLEIDD